MQSPIKGPSRLFGCKYKIMLMFLLSKSECAVPENIFTPSTHQEEGALKENTYMWGMDLLSKKTMSEKSLVTKYALRNILPANVDCQKIL